MDYRIKPELLDAAIDALTDSGQLFNGWHADGTVWSEWDESVRQKVSTVLAQFYKLRDERIRLNKDNSFCWPEVK